MKFNILTLFPDFFTEFKSESILNRAIENNLISINIINIRDFAFDKHKQADDAPFGGGAGMVMKIEPLMRALDTVSGKIIYTSPQGEIFTQKMAIELSKEPELTIIAGHYEGIDERVIQSKVDMEISIGDYVLTGGELPSMVIVDAVSRMIDGVIKKESYENDSFFNGLLDYPQYTRPYEYENMCVPDILISGHHMNIALWRLKESLKRTYIKRPDLLKNRKFTDIEKKLLDEIIKELKK
jgi:tRNA (guanine37-N1)-methyltransferase